MSFAYIVLLIANVVISSNVLQKYKSTILELNKGFGRFVAEW